jgi:hypothetical protein
MSDIDTATEGPYFCPQCGAEEADLTERVIAERDEQMTVLRQTLRSKKWSVILTCPQGHEVVFEGEFP